jgi:hypothetical protein
VGAQAFVKQVHGMVNGGVPAALARYSDWRAKLYHDERVASCDN